MEFSKLKWMLAAATFLVISTTIYGVTWFAQEPNPVLAVGVAAAIVISLWLGLHALARQVGMLPFKAKGRVLRGAKVHLDSAECLPVPAWMMEPPDEDDEDDPPPLSYYRLEITITPGTPKGSFHLWDPYDLSLVPKGFRTTWKNMADEDGEPGFEIEEIQLWIDGEFSDDFDKVPGRQKLRLKVGVPVGSREFQMLYYFETFGNITLPPYVAP